LQKCLQQGCCNQAYREVFTASFAKPERMAVENINPE
jgi:hypothetical protein